MPFHRPRRTATLVRDIPEVSISDPCIRVSVACDIECIERIKPEANRLLVIRMEVLGHRQVRVKVTRPAHVSISCGSECIRCRSSKSANAIVNAGSHARSGRRIRPKPVIDATTHDLQLAVLVRPRVSVAL